MPSPTRFEPSSPIDELAISERASSFISSSVIENEAKILQYLVSSIDLTSLEATDHEANIRALCERALRPVASRPEIGPVAAVCVYPSFVETAKSALQGSSVKLASVAGAFPSGLSLLDVKLLEVRRALELGADELDIVINRGAVLSKSYERAFDEIARIREASKDATLKVILETGELSSYDDIYRASRIAILAGADFIKTSTGKISQGAKLEPTLVMLDAIRDEFEESGRRVGIKIAGGVREAGLALDYLALVREALGEEWLVPEGFRIGASGLLGDIEKRLSEMTNG